jgi:hypothetical protein
MRAEQFEALREAAVGGVDFDGLRVAETADGYRFETPERTERGLSESELHAAAGGSDFVTNWYFWERTVGHGGVHRRRFLRHLEDADARAVPDRYEALADGLETEWGQLLVTARLDGDGDRIYEVRHVDDAGTPADELTRHEDPLDARDVRRFDDRGRYRPLSTAPTLDTGWVFSGLDGRAAVETVETFYPATVANWSLERAGDLDVSHWRETMERQTGIYGLIKTWDRGEGHEHVNRVAEACCVDSQCLKRREWEYDDDETLDVDGGDGDFPCREPCSVVVAAARQWTKLEGEQPRTYEFELTPSEKQQVEEIIDAVADGRAGDVREADIYDGANRYRARYLRAKRFDADGNLSGTPTEPSDGE